MLRRLRYKRYAVLVGLMLLLALILMPGIAPANDETPLETYQKEQRQIVDGKDKIEKEISASKTKKTSYEQEIIALDAQLVVLGQEIKSAQTALDALTVQIDDATTAIADATERLNERQAYLESRLCDIYINGDITMMDVFFSAASFDEFIVLYDMVDRIMTQDKELLDAITAELELIEKEKAILEKAKTDQEFILAELEAKNKELSQLQSAKAKASSELTMTIAQLEAKYEELEAASKAVEEKIKQELAKLASFAYSGGQFIWPLPAGQTNVTSEYGMRFHPILKRNTMHTGVDIGAPGGTKIFAVSSGKVVFRGWMGGYGQAVMIYHGDDAKGRSIVTLYAHMSKYGNYNEGDVVVVTDVIGYVGTTGQSTGNHLHFEVRIDGTHTNPNPYLGR